MSEKEKKDLPENEEVKEETTQPESQEPQAEETFTVTREQMEKMEALAKMVSDGNDKYLRLAAEYDNYRKRTAKEKENLYTTAKADTIRPFLDVYDNLERLGIHAEEVVLMRIEHNMDKYYNAFNIVNLNDYLK